MTLSEKEQQFVTRLLEWYETEGRHDLPWRQPDSTPFHVLIAEFLLQSTQAEQVEEVFPKMVRKYPTPEDVLESKSARQDIENLIEPIGLVKRTEYIMRSAELIIKQHGGRVPRAYSTLQELYGVGDYTAYAVLAHGHGANVGVVDTNIARILSRVFGLEHVEEPYTDEHWELTHRLVPEGSASDYNHALIDFGAKICTSNDPDCKSCPINDICEYYSKKREPV